MLCEDTNYAPELVRTEGSKNFQKFKRDNFSKVTHVSFQSLWKNKISFASESFEIWIDRYKMQIKPFERHFQKFTFRNKREHKEIPKLGNSKVRKPRNKKTSQNFRPLKVFSIEANNWTPEIFKIFKNLRKLKAVKIISLRNPEKFQYP